ncbi:MAG: rod shape-determining protein MreC [bacterium]|nr:rod shape-determining protein MreC [bacterium]
MPLFYPLFRKHRDKFVLALLVLLSLTLLLLPEKPRFTISKTLLNTVFYPVERTAHNLSEIAGLRAENRRLKHQVATLSHERERLLQYRAERQRLRRLADFKKEQSLKLVPCEVVGRNLARFQTLLTVDKGRNDSLAVRMPVLSYQGYVGRIVEVFDNSASVQLLSSRNNPVSCIDKRSRVIGILEWKHHNYFRMSNVSVVEDVQVGDTLITSGFGGVVPKGFPVAVISKITVDIDGLTLKVDAKSDIDFRSLESVFVVTDEILWERELYYEGMDSTLATDTLGAGP